MVDDEGPRRELLADVPGAGASGGGESLTTVLVAFVANVLIAIAKSVAAVMTASASLLAEAAHSWADAGNEVFLLIANRRAHKPADELHPLGHGREAYVWSLFAARAVRRGCRGLHHARHPGTHLAGTG